MAFLKAELNTNEDLLREWLLNIELYENKVFKIEEIEIYNPDYVNKKHNTEFKVKKIIKKYIEPYDVFKEIYSIGEIINNCIIKEDINNFNNNNEKTKEYKKIISKMASRKNNFKALFIIIISIILKFGITYTTKKDDYLKTCNVIDLLYFSYLIYETYTLYYCYQNGLDNKLKIYNHINTSNNITNILETINNNIIFLDNNIDNTSYYETTYDEENEKWNSFFVFENPLSITLYELKRYLSFDVNGKNIGVCKYCLNTFERIGTKQKTCNNYECITKRANERKRKSNNKKKTTKSN